jgi:hypothetical protein
MLLVLAHANDASARYAAAAIRRVTREDVQWLDVDSLAVPDVCWQERIGADGAPVQVKLSDGRQFRSGDADAVLNRVLAPPLLPITAISADARYAYSELTAFAASWIRNLGARVINEPSPQGLSGRWRSPLAWRVLAARAGLPIEALNLDSAHPGPVDDTLWSGGRMVLVVAGEPFDTEVPAAIRAAIGRFAVLAATPILGLRFSDPYGGEWRFLDATPLPDLLLGGEAGIAAIGRLLTR